MQMVRRMISIRDDQDKWLESHKEINFSGWVQKKLDEEIDNARNA